MRNSTKTLCGIRKCNILDPGGGEKGDDLLEEKGDFNRE